MKRFGLLLVALALIAIGCSSTSTETTVETASSDTPASDEPTDSANDEQNDTDDESDQEATTSSSDPDEPAMAASSPIGAFFSDDGGFEAAIADYTIKVEEAIVVCMAAQGFEFARTSNQVNEVQELQNELTLREWTTQFGYGISTSFDSVAQNQAADPNAEIIFSLSAAERDVWIQTLTGGEGFGAANGDFGATPLEEQGCIGEALISTGGQEAIEGIDTFSSAYEEGEEALFDRREMVDATDAWARCMGESGFPGFSELEDPEESIRDQFQTVMAPMQAALDELTPEEGQALIAGESLDLEDLPNLDIDALRTVQGDEKTLALADLDCYERDVKAIYEPLRDEFETGLLTEYATEFDALKNIGN